MEKEYTVVAGTYYDIRTPNEVIAVLESARINGDTVRLFLGDTSTGKDWLEEYDVTGTISRSMGPCAVPILLATPNSMGGDAILDYCIVRIMVNGVEKYRHPNYQDMTFEIIPTPEKKLPYAVTVNGETFAAFPSVDKANKWISFMKGE